MESRGTGVFAALLLLTAGACAALVAEARPRPDREARGEDFQRLVGGLGFGPALDLSGCAFGLDPRLDRSCSEDRGPVPGGACFCPRHAGALFRYPPPGPAEGGDAPPR